MLSYIPSIRRTNLLIFSACTGMMIFALILEHFAQMEPCPLCITQRVIVILIGVLGFLAWIHNPETLGRRIYALLTIITTGIGIGVAGRHVWLQNLPEDQQPACGPGLSYMIDALPLQDVVTLLFKGDGNCAEVAARFLGLTLPGWTLVAFVGLIVIALWQLIRKK